MRTNKVQIGKKLKEGSVTPDSLSKEFANLEYEEDSCSLLDTMSEEDKYDLKCDSIDNERLKGYYNANTDPKAGNYYNF